MKVGDGSAILQAPSRNLPKPPFFSYSEMGRVTDNRQLQCAKLLAMAAPYGESSSYSCV